MTENEIRIGNWIHHKATWSYRQLDPPNECDFQWDTQDWYALGECTLSLDDIEPIPLTEEWLCKFGFTQISGKQEYFKPFQGRYHNVLLGGLEPIYKMGYSDDGIIQLPIYYIHQLQNLYYALTGEELKIKTNGNTKLY